MPCDCLVTFVQCIRMAFWFEIKKNCLFGGETFVTLGTFEGSFSTVYPQMVLQGRRVSETFLTLRTFQRSFSTLYPQMYLKVRWLSETIFTPTTLAWRVSHYYVLTIVFSSVINIRNSCHTEYIWRVFLHYVSANGVASEVPIQKFQFTSSTILGFFSIV